MRRFFWAILLVSGCASPALAQTDSALLARVATLEAEVAKLRKEMGPYGDSIPPASFNYDVCPALPNLRYSVWCRVQQIGLGIDANNVNVAGNNVRVAGVEQRLAVVEARPEVPQVPPPAMNVEIPTDLRSALEAIGATFNSQGTLKAFKFAEYGNPEGPIFGYTGVDDAAYREFSNIRSKIGSAWPDIESNPNLPVLMQAFERDRGLSWDYSAPVVAGQNDPYPNKTYICYFGGFRRGVGPRGLRDIGPYMDCGTFEAGRGIRYFVRRPGSASPDTETILQMDAGGLAIRVGGGLRRVHMNADGTLRAGDAIIEDQ